MNENMSFKELYAIVRHRFVLILLITIGVTFITGFVQFKVISPTYQASTQVLIHESDGEENSNLSDIQRNLQYSKDVSIDYQKHGLDGRGQGGVTSF